MAGEFPRKRPHSVVEGLEPDEGRQKMKRLSQTCEWITKEPSYNQYSTKFPATLWIHGPVGCGKSFLSQYIIDSLEQDPKQPALLNYFCDEHSSADSILRSLFAQLIVHPKVPEVLRSEIGTILGGLLETPILSSDTSFKLWDKLLAVPRVAPFQIIIDGMDELPARDLDSLGFNLPARLVDLATQNSGTVKLLISSRMDDHLKNSFQTFPEISITPDKIYEDMETYISSEVGRHASLAKLHEFIIPHLLRQSGGSFIQAELLIKILSMEPIENETELQDSPESLNNVYGRLFATTTKTLHEPDRILRDHVLRWINTAIRPVRSLEIANAATIRANLFILEIDSKAIEVCSSLIKSESKVLKPWHSSLKDFLRSEHPALETITEIRMEQANADIAGICLEYLSHVAFSRLGHVMDVESILSMYPLLEYASLYWVHHASEAAKSNFYLQTLIKTFFESPNAFLWADYLLPGFLPSSVIPVPPRPKNSARFAHLFVLKGKIINCFEGPEKQAVDKQISDFLISSYEDKLATERLLNGSQSHQAMQRMLDLSEVYGWLPSHRGKSRALLQEAMEFLPAQIDADAMSIALSVYQAFADDSKRSGRYEEAKTLLNTMLDMAKGVISPTDLRIMFALDSIGWICMRLGELENSSTYLQQALDIAAERSGSSSPMTLRSKVTLAEVLNKLGRADEAEALCVELMAQVRECYQNDVPLPPDSVSQLNTLAAVYKQTGKLIEAAETYSVVVKSREKIFGDEHPMTLWATMQLGIAKESIGDVEAALRIFETLLPKQERVLGLNHPDIAETSRHLNALNRG